MHDDYTLLMSLVLDGEASAQEAMRLRSHLRGCNACSSTWQRWQELDSRFDAAPMLVTPAGLADRVMARISEAQTERQQGNRFAFWLGLACAIALVLAGLIATAAATWPIEAPGAVGAALSGITGAVAWVWRIGMALVARAGLPTVAATAGATVSLTCVLAVFWLWIVNRGIGNSEAAPSVA